MNRGHLTAVSVKPNVLRFLRKDASNTGFT
jgi:hypothetical protein